MRKSAKQWAAAVATLDNMRPQGQCALSHVRFALQAQSRIGYRGPGDGGETYARVRDGEMVRVAAHNFTIASRAGIVFG